MCLQTNTDGSSGRNLDSPQMVIPFESTGVTLPVCCGILCQRTLSLSVP